MNAKVLISVKSQLLYGIMLYNIFSKPKCSLIACFLIEKVLYNTFVKQYMTEGCHD